MQVENGCFSWKKCEELIANFLKNAVGACIMAGYPVYFWVESLFYEKQFRDDSGGLVAQEGTGAEIANI